MTTADQTRTYQVKHSITNRLRSLKKPLSEPLNKLSKLALSADRKGLQASLETLSGQARRCDLKASFDVGQWPCRTKESSQLDRL